MKRRTFLELLAGALAAIPMIGALAKRARGEQLGDLVVTGIDPEAGIVSVSADDVPYRWTYSYFDPKTGVETSPVVAPAPRLMRESEAFRVARDFGIPPGYQLKLFRLEEDGRYHFRGFAPAPGPLSWGTKFLSPAS